LKEPLVSLRSWFDPYHGIFFPYTFFIRFIKFSSAVEMSSSIQNFSSITFFCNEIFNVFCFRKNHFRIDSFNFEYLWCDLAKKNFKRFLNLQNIEYLLTKKCYGAEILHGGRHLICGWEFDKTNKKSIREKNPMIRIPW
jgi:hypothetical protein